MALRKTTLTYDDRNEQWKLNDDKTNRTIKSFDTKTEATAGGVLKGALGAEGGSSVKSRK